MSNGRAREPISSLRRAALSIFSSHVQRTSGVDTGKTPDAGQRLIETRRAELACDAPVDLRIILQWFLAEGSSRYTELVFEGGMPVEWSERPSGARH